MSSRLFICTFVSFAPLTQALRESLSRDRYDLTEISSSVDLQKFVQNHKEQIDCLILQSDLGLYPFFNQLYEQGILLPVVLLTEGIDLQKETNNGQQDVATFLYHTGEVHLARTLVSEIGKAVDQAIAQFLRLAPSCPFPQPPPTNKLIAEQNTQAFLMLQQRRLAEKLHERLGYLGVYYKRDPRRFFRNLSKSDQKNLLRSLSQEYRQIILNYFLEDPSLNQAIDQFVNRAFFADLSVSRILEIHMDLMDEFAQQLQLEGRSDEILLDYRLALIDIIAHLGEMYRRSIPREDIPLEILTHTDL